MPSITAMMSLILRDDSLIWPIVVTTSCTTAPPCMAMPDALSASVLAWRALSAFCLTMEVSSSMLDAVSSSELACSSVRCDRLVLPAAICCVAEAIDSLPRRTVSTVSLSLPCICCRPSISTPISSRERTRTSVVRLPEAISRKCTSISASGSEMARDRIR